MNQIALILSIFSLLTLLISISIYFSSLLKNKVPVKPIGLTISLVVALLVAFISLFISSSVAFLSALPTAIPAVITVFLSSFLLFLLSLRKTPIGNISIGVGDNFLPFSSLTNKSTQYSPEDITGQRTLLKFYRGSWCLYCTRELMMFNDMKSLFEKYNVNVVGISGDNVEQANAHVERDKLHFTLLADPSLSIIKQYGVEHHKSLGTDASNIMTIFGMPLPSITQLKFKAMSIPTSILIDENGIVQWVDQSTDYRVRASQDRIIEALEKSFA